MDAACAWTARKRQAAAICGEKATPCPAMPGIFVPLRWQTCMRPFKRDAYLKKPDPHTNLKKIRIRTLKMNICVPKKRTHMRLPISADQL